MKFYIITILMVVIGCRSVKDACSPDGSGIEDYERATRINSLLDNYRKEAEVERKFLGVSYGSDNLGNAVFFIPGFEYPDGFSAPWDNAIVIDTITGMGDGHFEFFRKATSVAEKHNDKLKEISGMCESDRKGTKVSRRNRKKIGY